MLNNLQHIHLKLLQEKVIKKIGKETGDLIGNKTANRIAKVSRSPPQNKSKTITIEHDEEIPKERYRTPEERQKIIDDLN